MPLNWASEVCQEKGSLERSPPSHEGSGESWEGKPSLTYKHLSVFYRESQSVAPEESARPHRESRVRRGCQGEVPDQPRSCPARKSWEMILVGTWEGERSHPRNQLRKFRYPKFHPNIQTSCRLMPLRELSLEPRFSLWNLSGQKDKLNPLVDRVKLLVETVYHSYPY